MGHVNDVVLGGGLRLIVVQNHGSGKPSIRNAQLYDADDVLQVCMVSSKTRAGGGEVWVRIDGDYSERDLAGFINSDPELMMYTDEVRDLREGAYERRSSLPSGIMDPYRGSLNR
tara:strand:+ start:209 stop:553 length:345 start_codon:yes stop_codon:yes gene_type:complete